jgi:hypothetical protein
MAYVECKIHEEGHEPCLVKALIDTSSAENIIRKSLVDKLGIKYSDPPKYIKRRMKGIVGVVESLELSFRFKGKDKLVSGSDEVLNDFVVCKEPKADLVLGMPWLWLRETKIDPRGERISIYGGVVPFYKDPESVYIPSDDSESDTSSYYVSASSNFHKSPHSISRQKKNKCKKGKDKSDLSNLSMEELTDMFKNLSFRSGDNESGSSDSDESEIRDPVSSLSKLLSEVINAYRTAPVKKRPTKRKIRKVRMCNN